MEFVVTSGEMRSFDHFAIESLHVPGIVLMENAGGGVVRSIEKEFGALEGRLFLIVCGKGNNGGDGFVAARHLLNRNAKVIVFLTCKPSELKGDSLANFQIIKKIAGKINPQPLIRIQSFTSIHQLSKIPQPEFILDCLFGTGFKGGLEGQHLKLVQWINEQPAKRISVDIASGVNADTGEVVSGAVKSGLTITMSAKKIGLLCGEGREHSGKIEIVDIGVSPHNLSKNKSKTFLIEQQDVRSILPERSLLAHKHNVGKIFVLAGSSGLTGAAAMAAQSAMRAGAGAVILATPKSAYSILSKKLTEVMVVPLEETSHGTVSGNGIEEITKRIDWADIVVIGPGLSRNEETQKVIQLVISQCKKPMLIDADGLNAIAGNPSLLKKRKSKEVILTPHTGELSRITGLTSKEIETNRVEVAREVAKKYNLTLVLKGAPTVTASATGGVFINSTGNPGMATAGSGDVLSGIIAGVWGQGMISLQAAWSGVYLHGKAGDIAKEQYGEKSLLALDIQEMLPKAFQQIESNGL